MRIHQALTVATAAVALLTSCAASPAGEPAPETTVQVMVDYPAYDDDGLLDEATLIVEGTVVSSVAAWRPPTEADGDTPEENPQLGLSEEEKAAALAGDRGVVTTSVTFRVDTVHRGSVTAGQEITVLQTGGTVDGVTYRVDAEPPLQTQQHYLLFGVGTHGVDDAFVIIGGSAGAYASTGDGTFAAMNPTMAPFQTITRAEVISLTS